MQLDRDRDGRPGSRSRWLRRIDVGAVVAWVLGIGTLVLVLVLVYRGTRVEVTQTGLEDGAVFNALSVAAVDVRIELPSPDDVASAELRFDGELVEEPTVEGSTIRWRPPEGLEEGDHTLALSVARVLLSDARFRWDFTLDVTPPTVEAPVVAETVAIDQPATVSGTVERGASLVAGGRDVEVGDDGQFTLSFPRPPAGPVVLEAIDAAGNRTTTNVVVPVALPSMRAVYVTAAAWSSDGLRDRVLQLVDERRIDTVVLDLKDESGVVGFDTTVERAAQIGAVTNYYDLEDAVATLEQHGARVVGRIAAFHDPILAQAAWAAGQTDQVIQAPDNQPYEAPGQFTNFAHPAVQRYNLDIAIDAVNRGVHDILWDDARQPGDDPSNVLVPGYTGAPSDALVGFLADAHVELRRRGAFQGVALEGLSADSGDLYAQDVAQMARRADYLVPELHPAFWAADYYGVASPISQPGDLVARALARFAEVARDSGTVLSPSLQDFSARGSSYGADEVRVQIDAAASAGSTRFVLWDPSVTYTADALAPQQQ
ncbi:MAG: putative glycoside hydrolase [Acidimicrobiales bacterium]